MVEDKAGAAAKARRELLARVYALILSWPDPKDETPRSSITVLKMMEIVQPVH
jgi:hypothetical protein